MTKDRPFKTYKTPNDRPFKSYDPVRTSLLFENFQQEQQLQHQQAQQQQQQQQQQLPSQSLRLNSMNSLIQQQPQSLNTLMFSQTPQQQQPQQSASTTNQQVYGDPEDFIHFNPQSTTSMNTSMTIDSNLNPYYDELGLDDPDNPLIRPELLVTNESLLQREQDLNIPNTTTPPNFIVPSIRHGGIMPRLPLLSSSSSVSMQDSLSMLFDQPQPSMSVYSSSTSVASSSSSDLQPHQFLMSKSADRNGMHHSSSSYPVKQEADDGRASLVESPSPSVQSPTQSEPADSFTDAAPKTGVKRSLSDGASIGSADQEKQSEEGTSSGANCKSESPKDPSYLEKRRKNNESAKRSREARRSKEELVALRVITLEEENMKLRAEIAMLDKELDELRQRLFSPHSQQQQQQQQ